MAAPNSPLEMAKSFVQNMPIESFKELGKRTAEHTARNLPPGMSLESMIAMYEGQIEGLKELASKQE